MIDLTLFPCFLWGRRHRQSDAELGLCPEQHDMIKITVNDEISGAHPQSVSDGTVESSSSETQHLEVAEEPEQTENESPSREAPQQRSRWVRWIPLVGHRVQSIPDGRFDKIKYESINSYREGYPQWAAYQNSDPSFRIYKRFGTLRNRVILYRQQELALLEEELNELDDQDHRSNNFKTRSFLIDKEESESKRLNLIDQIDSKLKNYDDLLEREKKSGLMEKPTARNYRSLVNYIHNNKPVIEEEIQFLGHRDDFVLLAGQSESPLESFLDQLVCKIPVRWIRRQFSSEAQTHKATDGYTILTSPRKIALLARGVASLLAVLLIGAPLVVLASDGIHELTKLIVVLLSLFAFPLAIQISARPRNLELFVATATYCAVLTTLLAISTPFDIIDLVEKITAAVHDVQKSVAP